MDCRTVDYHTAGEPFRIALDGVPPIAGRLLAQMICGEPTDLDPGPFDPRRFAAARA